MTSASSPCVKLCVLHETTRTCLGCGRTLDEIGAWSGMAEPERRAIMQRLAGREKPSVRRAARERGTSGPPVS